MIYKPYSLLPSDLEDGSGVIDIAGDVEMSFQVSGTSPIKTITIEMGDLSGSGTSEISMDYSSNPIYYTGIDGKPVVIKLTLTSVQISSIVGDSPEQKWRVKVADTSGSTAESDWVLVVLKTTPSAMIYTSTSVSTKYNRWVLDYTPSVTYESKTATDQDTSMRSIRWLVFDRADQRKALYDTGNIYGCVDPSYNVDGLMSGHTYYAEVIVINQDGVETTAVSDDVSVSYEQGSSGIMKMVYTDEVAEIPREFSFGHDIALDITNFSGASGVSSGGQSGYEIENLGAPTGFVLKNKTGNTIVWDHIDLNDSDTITVRFRFTPFPYRREDDILSLYIDDACTTRVRYAITTASGIGTVYPEEDLYPSDTLYPNVGSYLITAFFEYLSDDLWTVYSTFDTSVDMNNLSDGDIVYYEHTFQMSDIVYPD